MGLELGPKSFFQGYRYILLTFFTYIVSSTKGCSPSILDAIMSTIENGRNLVLWIFKGHRGEQHQTTCCALLAAGPYL